MSVGAVVAIAVLIPFVWAAWQARVYRAQSMGLRDGLREIRDELAHFRSELDQQRTLHSELQERLDFVERALARLPPGPPAK